MPAAKPVPSPVATPLRIPCLVGSSSSFENSWMLCASRPMARTVRMLSTTSAARAPASTAELAAASANLATTFAWMTTGTAMAGTMQKTSSVSCQEALNETPRPPTSTTIWEAAIDARSPVSAWIMVQSCERRLTRAPTARSGATSNQPMFWRTRDEKAASRTRRARRCVTTAKQYWRRAAPRAATPPMARNTSAHFWEPLRISSTSTLKKTTMNSAMRKPMAGMVRPVIMAPTSPSAK
mmetsp:Transcript_65991/g.193514  ORF Transcript_65991/g.193514 Transcript_65991/m.193514 type:complete len:239 (-) Transcript_65991:376-1092(-)